MPSLRLDYIRLLVEYRDKYISQGMGEEEALVKAIDYLDTKIGGKYEK